MSRITQELREIAQIANLLSKGNGSVTTTTSPDYSNRGLYSKIESALNAKIAALEEIKPEEYRAIVLSGAEALDIVGRPMTAAEMAETIKRVQENMTKGDPFSKAAAKEIAKEAEPMDSVEQHTIDTTKEPTSGADPRD
jgi:hypothetical protein